MPTATAAAAAAPQPRAAASRREGMAPCSDGTEMPSLLGPRENASRATRSRCARLTHARARPHQIMRHTSDDGVEHVAYRAHDSCVHTSFWIVDSWYVDWP